MWITTNFYSLDEMICVNALLDNFIYYLPMRFVCWLNVLFDSWMSERRVLVRVRSRWSHDRQSHKHTAHIKSLEHEHTELDERKTEMFHTHTHIQALETHKTIFCRYIYMNTIWINKILNAQFNGKHTSCVLSTHFYAERSPLFDMVVRAMRW